MLDQYTDFPLRISHHPPDDPCVVLGGADAAVEHLVLPAPATDAPGTTGRALFESLVCGQIYEAYRRELGKLRGEERLRITLTFDQAARAYARYPWELMRDGDRLPLTLADASLVRRIGDDEIAPLTLDLPLRVLLTAADTNPPVPLAGQLRHIAAELGQLKGDVEIVYEPHLTAERLRQLLRQRFHVWHFVGHSRGSNDGLPALLVFEDGTGERAGAALDTEKLAVLLNRSGVRLVVLNACKSGMVAQTAEGVAPALCRHGVAAVVAMQNDVSVADARTFAKAFYGSLAGYELLDTCVLQARQALMLQADSAESWANPVIYSSAPNGVLFVQRHRARAHILGTAVFLEAIEQAATRNPAEWRALSRPLLATLAAADGPLDADELIQLTREREYADTLLGDAPTAQGWFVTHWGAFLAHDTARRQLDFINPALRKLFRSQLSGGPIMVELAAETRRAREALIATMRGRMRTPLCSEHQRHQAARQLARMNWLHTDPGVPPPDLPTEELIAYLDLLSDLDRSDGDGEDGQHDWALALIAEISTLLRRSRWARTPAQIARLLLYRAAVTGYRYDSLPESDRDPALLAKAESDYDAVRALLMDAHSAPRGAEYHRLQARYGLGMGALALDREDVAGAIALLTAAHDHVTRCLELSEDAAEEADEPLLVAVMANLVHAYQEAGRLDLAAPVFDDAERRLEAARQAHALTFYNTPHYAAALEAASVARHGEDHFEGAYRLAQATIDLFGEVGFEHKRLTIAHINAGEYLTCQEPGDPAGAEKLRRQAHGHWRQAQALIDRGFGAEYQVYLDDLIARYPPPGAALSVGAP